MSETLPKLDESSAEEDSPWVESPDIPGLWLSKNGPKSAEEWDAYFKALPDLGEDGERFHEAILELRRTQREAAQNKSDDDGW